ncbi:hypothetical protein D3C74_90660 [compost metagenome]
MKEYGMSTVWVLDQVHLLLIQVRHDYSRRVVRVKETACTMGYKTLNKGRA